MSHSGGTNGQRLPHKADIFISYSSVCVCVCVRTYTGPRAREKEGRLDQCSLMVPPRPFYGLATVKGPIN